MNLVGAISTRASCNPADGHFYWTYEALSRFQLGNNRQVPATIGTSDRACDFIEPVLSPQTKGTEFTLNILTLFSYRIRRLKTALSKRTAHGFDTYFVYDGGLSEFFVTVWLAQELSQVKFVFNFHWADAWISVTTEKTRCGKLMRQAVREVIQSSGPNIIFSAETKPLATKLGKDFGTHLSVFPVFTILGDVPSVPWKIRTTDVLLLPQRTHELDFTFALTAELRSKGLTVIIGLREEILTRWRGTRELPDGVKMVFFPLQKSDYVGLLGSSRIVVLPYDKPYFRWGSSGKFADAIALGCLPLAPRGTAIATQSSERPTLHEFNMRSVAGTSRTIQEALSVGPPKMYPVTAKTFLDWISSLQGLRNAKPRRIQHLKLGLLVLIATGYQIGQFVSTKTIWLKKLTHKIMTIVSCRVFVKSNKKVPANPLRQSAK